MTKESPIMVYSPGENEWQWIHNGKGDHQITYPVKLTGFAVSMQRKTLVLKELEDTKQY